MVTPKENNTLSEIRQEYKAKRKQLEKYDRFIDRHQGLVVFMPLLLVLVGVLTMAGMTSGTATQAGGNMTVKIVGIISLVVLVAAVIMAFITSSRKSAKSKLEKQLEALKQEAVVFQKHAKDHRDITRDELGLWRDIEQDGSTKSHHKAIGVSVIVTVLTVLAAPFIFSQINNRNNSDSQAQVNQAQCLNDAYATYEKSWKDADKDSDGSLSFQDGATSITTSYYDAAIACYRTNKTADSNDYIADYQTKRQQEVDKYTAWLEASKLPTYVPSYSSGYSSGMNCTSNSIGSSTYTRCY